MSKKLAATVHVDGKVYKAGESVDADVAKQITNPKAWGEAEAASDDAEGGDEGDKPARRSRRSSGDNQ